MGGEAEKKGSGQEGRPAELLQKTLGFYLPNRGIMVMSMLYGKMEAEGTKSQLVSWIELKDS